MKARFYPSKDTVRSIITDRIGAEESLLNHDETEYAKLTDGSVGTILRPGQDVALGHLIRKRKSWLEEKRFELKLLDSHNPQEVMVEIEL